jgi:hypothetical protein
MLYHGHLPYMVGHRSVNRARLAVKQGVLSGIDFDPFEARRELLTTVDFAGWIKDP